MVPSARNRGKHLYMATEGFYVYIHIGSVVKSIWNMLVAGLKECNQVILRNKEESKSFPSFIGYPAPGAGNTADYAKFGGFVKLNNFLCEKFEAGAVR